ncbi:MAG: serine hydrolase [Calditrichaeota bacterium]|nr:serine hydrolase [Calditrichota bacterium]
MKHFWKKIPLILLTGIVFMLSGCAKKTLDTEKLKQEIERLCADFPQATVAVAFEDLPSGASLFINEKVQMHAASTMKTPVMIEVFKQAQEGRLRLTDSIEVKNEFRSIVDGSKFSLSEIDDSDDIVYRHLNKKMTIRDLVYQMITVSSNFATNLLIDLVGAENVSATMHSIGAKNIQVLRGVEDLEAFRAGLNNTTDAYDMYLIMKKIALKEVVSPEACDEMIAILVDQRFKDKIPRYLPSTIRVAHKTGWITGIDHDAAIVYLTPEHPYILVVMTKGIKNHVQAQELIGQISKKIFEEINSI